jgi:cytochrome subunit of sulfide dehydrogenase
MLARRVIGGLALLISPAGPLAAAAANDPPGATSCSGCHAASAAVETPVPRLVGRPAPEIVAAMRDFRTGLRPGSIMDRIAKGFSVGETAAIAAWYSEQKQ